MLVLKVLVLVLMVLMVPVHIGADADVTALYNDGMEQGDKFALFRAQTSTLLAPLEAAEINRCIQVFVQSRNVSQFVGELAQVLNRPERLPLYATIGLMIPQSVQTEYEAATTRATEQVLRSSSDPAQTSVSHFAPINQAGPLAQSQSQNTPHATAPTSSPGDHVMTQLGSKAMRSHLAGKLRRERTLNVFLSSPFAGLETERRAFVERYLPLLQHQCQAAGVALACTDLRWGITAEDASQQRTLDICLREIDRADVFVGLYGRRYGSHRIEGNPATEWLDGNLKLAAINYPFVMQWASRSITELEFRHGCLNAPDRRPAMFFFRDPAYDARLATERVGHDDAHAYVNPDPESARLREQLETDVKHLALAQPSLQIHTQSYTVPEAAAEQMYHLLEALLTDVLPVPAADAHAVDAYEANSHINFANTRRSLFLGADTLRQNLQDLVKAAKNPVAVLGPSGSGKSALLANWLVAHETRHPRDRVFVHFCGCDGKSTALHNLLMRLCTACASPERAQLLVSASTEALVEQLPELLRSAAKSCQDQGQGRLLVVIDALNQLDNDELPWLGGATVHSLAWLPVDLPPNMQLIVSTLPGPCEDELKHRHYVALQTQPLDAPNKTAIAETILGRVGKKLSPHQLARLVASPACGNPLHLLLLLEELIAFGHFYRLDDKLDQLLSAPAVPELLDMVLARIDDSFAEHRELVPTLMRAIFVSREGVPEIEVYHLLQAWHRSSPHKPAPLLITAALQVNRHLLIDRGGRLNFLHDYIRQAVQQRYVTQIDALVLARVHDLLADGLREQPLFFPAGKAEHDALVNLEFLDAKCVHGMVHELLDDIHACLQHQQRAALQETWQLLLNTLPLLRFDLRRWNMATGRVEAVRDAASAAINNMTVLPPAPACQDVALLGDNLAVVSCSETQAALANTTPRVTPGCVQVWDLQARRELARFTDVGTPLGLAVDHTSNVVFVYSYGHLLEQPTAVRALQWDGQALTQIAHADLAHLPPDRLDARERLLGLRLLAWHASSQVLYVVDGCDLRRMSLKSRTQLLPVAPNLTTPHTGAITNLAVRETTVVTVGADKRISVLDIGSGEVQAQLYGHSWTIFGLDLSAEWLVTGGGIWDKRALVWDLAAAKTHPTQGRSGPEGFGQGIMGTCWLQGTRLLLTTGQFGPRGVYLWHYPALSLHSRLCNADGSPFVALGYNPVELADGRLVIADARGQLAVFTHDRATDVYTRLAEGLAQAAVSSRVVTSSLAAFPDGRHLAFSGNGLHIVDAFDDEQVATAGNVNGQQMRVSQSARRLAISTKGKVEIYQCEPLQLLGEVSAPAGVPNSTIYGIDISLDDTTLAVAFHDGLVVLWDLHTFSLRGTLQHTDRVYAAVFCGDGRHLACAGDDQTVTIWHFHRQEPVARLFIGASIGALLRGPGGELVAGDDAGAIHRLLPPHEKLVCTAAQRWNELAGHYEATVVCPWTRQPIPLPAPMIADFSQGTARMQDMASPLAPEQPAFSLLPIIALVPGTMTVEDIARDMLEQFRGQLAPQHAGLADGPLAFVRYTHGKDQGKLAWLPSKDVLRTSHPLTPAEGQASAEGTRVVARHPLFESAWDASLSGQTNGNEGHVIFDDGDQRWVVWDLIYKAFLLERLLFVEHSLISRLR
ncbi:uncharacterized protein MONBRDRAFT_24824 [Monosiga brevicollis MX1]|uniref:DUF4062 domain-containing protein n=1 Tax=Monosiga brevicollis TaxID=81824 RepID=A9UXU8_MONBE|nr:uncharacterized protein MONBRDRAFT_24824 [Monosiga brevicollis MX1]EDQ89909.1 predicted protein [Monosiga brevicollis MX1]|eukprot:XP_001745331.1 hypothetical protein [Monosiga brevicollis MX1]